jgi:beta-lactamase class A
MLLTGAYHTAPSSAGDALSPRPSATPTAAPSAGPTADPRPTVASAPSPAPTPAARSTAQLQAEVVQLAQESDANVGVALVELGGSQPLSWNYQGDQSFVAASTYKLPLLMEEAQLLAAGSIGASDSLCYSDTDWEDGWFADYADGSCYTRQELATRVGQESDNTAAHILADTIGGGSGLNAYARAHGAMESEFYDPNTTTANALARLWVNEASGQAGGAAAQRWLYPLLTHTNYETGIPFGTPSGTNVVHKIGILDSEVNDAALVTNGPRGAYVLVVMTDGPGGSGGWQLAAAISSAVWQFEAARQ